MTAKLYIAIFLFFTAVLFNGCDDSVNGTSINGKIGFQSEQSPYVLAGTVVDANNIPVVGANIHFMFNLTGSGLTESFTSLNPMPTTTISFYIQTKSPTSLKIYRLGTRELMATLLDTTLNAGMYSQAFDLSTFTNGWYVFRLISDKLFEERAMFFQQTELKNLLKTKSLTKTDIEGKFRLPQSIFGFDEQFLAATKIDSIGIVIYRTDKNPLVQWITINKNSNMEKTFILQ